MSIVARSVGLPRRGGAQHPGMPVLHPALDFDQVMAKHPDGGEVILVNVGGTVRAWRNRCPHVGVGLDWGDGRCLGGPDELVCAMHGALFQASTGLCTAGPCAGDALEAVPIRIVDGRIELA